jgi:hypothetical protein
VPKKKNPKPFRAVTAAKALARERIGIPRTQTVIPDKREKVKMSKKYKPTLGKLLSQQD